MKNIEKLIYSYKHRKVVEELAKKYGCYDELKEQLQKHDLDKMYLLLFYEKKDIEGIHRDLSNHHDNSLEKSDLDYIEMVLDWESARYTKPDKPLNAYDTLIKFYPNLKEKILPILKKFKIDKSNLPMDKDIVEYCQTIDNINEEDIKNELINYINNLN